jgi:putative NIF3 family GTP cyclohydrolase 1 type 2
MNQFLDLPNPPADGHEGRRKFIATLTKITGGVFLFSHFTGRARALFQPAAITVGQIMDSFISEVPGAPFDKTVDTLKCGKREMVVSGVVTTMFPTLEVIKKTIELGANFIIAHEPSFYNHLDETKWLENDDVYHYKWDLLTKNNITIWRNHDYIHGHSPDGVLEGVVNKLNWKAYQDANNNSVFNLAAMDVKTLIQKLKTGLDISMVRYIGDLSQSCRKILLLPGAYGGKRQSHWHHPARCAGVRRNTGVGNGRIHKGYTQQGTTHFIDYIRPCG